MQALTAKVSQRAISPASLQLLGVWSNTEALAKGQQGIDPIKLFGVLETLPYQFTTIALSWLIQYKSAFRRPLVAVSMATVPDKEVEM